MGLLKSLFGLGRTMLIQDREPYHRPELQAIGYDKYGHVVTQIIHANSAQEADRHLNGMTIQGDRSVVTTHLTDIQRGLYDVHIENWDTGAIGKGMTRSVDYDADAYLNERAEQYRSNQPAEVDWNIIDLHANWLGEQDY